MVKKDVMIKRVIRNKKYFVEHREKGKLIERLRWSPRPKSEKFTTSKIAVKNYNKQGSIYENRRRYQEKTWKFTEETRSTPSNFKQLKKTTRPTGLSRRRNASYQYVVEGVIYLKNGRHLNVVASSQQHLSSYPIEKAREEARESFYERSHFMFNGSVEGNYDAGEGAKLVEDGKVEVLRESIKHYVPR